MRIALFDWTTGGHHALYVRRVADALGPHADLVVAAPDALLAQAGELPADVRPLPDARPALDLGAPLAPQHRRHAEAELDRFARFAREARADHVVHLYADPVIRRLVRRPPFPAPVSVVVFFPRAHYPSAFATPLTPGERARALFLEALVARWRRRRDAHAVLTLDPCAAERWARRRGAPAHLFPEPPVGAEAPAVPAAARSGCVVYGALAARKGIDRLAAAVAAAPAPPRVVLAGDTDPGYADELAGLVRGMRAAGATVELRAHRHTEGEGLRALAEAACAVLPYPAHNGMSRVLVEAAAARTPVVVHDRGLLAHLVRRHGLGVAVDCGDPRALGDALARLTGDPAAVAAHAGALAAFAARHDPERFAGALRPVFGLGAPAPAGPPAAVAAGR